jgi:hypothetical protein
MFGIIIYIKMSVINLVCGGFLAFALGRFIQWTLGG